MVVVVFGAVQGVLSCESCQGCFGRMSSRCCVFHGVSLGGGGLLRDGLEDAASGVKDSQCLGSY